jgi:hypothetical protein
MTLVALFSCSPVNAGSAKDHLQAAAPSSNAAGASETGGSVPIVLAEATVTQAAGGTTTYFGPATQQEHAAAKPEPLPPPTLTAAIDLANQKMTVSVNGEALYSWAISSGTSRYPTPTGTFYPEWTAKMWYSRKYDWAPMPNAVFINGGVAVHATNAVGLLGSPASHGCIRLSPANAKTFYNLVQRHGLKMTRVAVFGRPNWRTEAVASRERPRAKTVVTTGEWLFGNPWGVTEEAAYTPSFTKKSRSKYAYGSEDDGASGKVRRRKTGEAGGKAGAQRHKYSSAAASAE